MASKNCTTVLISTQLPEMISCGAIDELLLSDFLSYLHQTTKTIAMYVVMMCTVCDNFCKKKKKMQ